MRFYLRERIPETFDHHRVVIFFYVLVQRKFCVKKVHGNDKSKIGEINLLIRKYSPNRHFYVYIHVCLNVISVLMLLFNNKFFESLIWIIFVKKGSDFSSTILLVLDLETSMKFLGESVTFAYQRSFILMN